MKMLPANPGLTDLDERARSIHRRVRKLWAAGKLDTLAEQTAVLELARLIGLRQKIEAAKAAKKRRRSVWPRARTGEVGQIQALARVLCSKFE